VPQQLIPLVLVLPTVGVLLLLALPFIDRDPERNPFERPAVMVPGAFAVLFVVLLTLLGSGRLFTLWARSSPSLRLPCTCWRPNCPRRRRRGTIASRPRRPSAAYSRSTSWSPAWSVAPA